VEFVVVRHAEPEAITVSEGSADPGLTALGRAQAEALARCPGLGHLDMIVQSPARRAIETAAPLAACRGLIPITLDGLTELDWGAKDYTPVETMRARNDPRWQAAVLRGEGWGVDASWFRARVVETFTELAVANAGATRIAAVCHNGVLNAWIGEVIGMERLLWLHAAYTSYSRVAVARDGRRGILSLNETPHLLAFEQPADDLPISGIG
jgi:broad specificity phosphatase PhoE